MRLVNCYNSRMKSPKPRDATSSHRVWSSTSSTSKLPITSASFSGKFAASDRQYRSGTDLGGQVRMRACRFKVNQLVFAILLLLQLWCVRIQAQHSDVSDNKKIIEEPERLSGVWETEIGSEKPIAVRYLLYAWVWGQRQGSCKSVDHHRSWAGGAERWERERADGEVRLGLRRTTRRSCVPGFISSDCPPVSSSL
jgi:hypothetical protein